MSIRREPTYLSTDVWRSFWMLSKAQSTEIEKISADELIDDVLRSYLDINHPQLLEHHKKISKLETDLIKTLQ